MVEMSQEEIDAAYERADMKNFTVEIKERKNREDDVYYFTKKSNDHVGYGFISKIDNPDRRISLTTCPACRRNNYASNVLSGYCTWCPFNANGEKN